MIRKMIIGLVAPVCNNKFYVNPLNLQIIATKLRLLSFYKELDVELLDRNTTYGRERIISENFDIVIIDVPENELECLGDALNIIHASSVFLVGDEIKYGQCLRILQYLRKRFGQKFTIDASIIDDYAIAFVINKYYKRPYQNWLEASIMNNKTLDRSFLCNVDMGSLVLNFPTWMLDEYEKRGVQIFIDGIARGCENHCTFCKLNNGDFMNHKPVPSQVDAISTIESIQNNVRKRLYVQFTDENFFGGDIQRIESILTLVEQLRNINFHGLLGIDTRLDTILRQNESLKARNVRLHAWESMAKIGLKYCFLGVETFSPTQAARYGKRLDLSTFEKSIAYLRNLGIYYTIGLILWDPLMTVDELKTNLQFIESHNLLGKTASLLKPMRIMVNSKYWKRYGSQCIHKDQIHSNLYLFENVTYVDPYIQAILPFVRYAYYALDKNGYRHSDVALFQPLCYNSKVLVEIPFLVSSFEYTLIRDLLTPQVLNANAESVYTHINDKICSLAKTILSGLNEFDDVQADTLAIKRYYISVFSRVLQSVEH